MKITPRYIVKKSLLGGYDVIDVDWDIFELRNTTEENAREKVNELNWLDVAELFKEFSGKFGFKSIIIKEAK